VRCTGSRTTGPEAELLPGNDDRVRLPPASVRPSVRPLAGSQIASLAAAAAAAAAAATREAGRRHPASPSRSQVLSVAQTSHIVDLQVGQTSSARADRGHEINIIIYFISVLVNAMKRRRGINWHFKKQKGHILIH